MLSNFLQNQTKHNQSNIPKVLFAAVLILKLESVFLLLHTPLVWLSIVN